MNKEIIKRIYKESTDFCAEARSTEAWFWEEKFAELLLLEAAKLCDRVYPEGSPLHLVSLGFGQTIRDHFGIK